MASNQVTLEILAEIKGALKGFETLQKDAASSLSDIEKTSRKSFEGFQKNASSNLSTISSGFKLLGGAAIAAAGIFAGKAVIGAFGDFVNAAAEGQQALQNLNTIMALSGDFTKKASDDFVAFASNIQSTTKFEDDLVISQLAVAKSFGLSNDKAKELVSAAVELSSVTGDSLNTSVEQLGKTLSGTAGLLSKTRPELRGLSEEALKSGAGIKAVLDTLGGAAASQVQTFSGALEQSKNVFGQFGENIGSIVVDNPAVIAAIGAISKIVSALSVEFLKVVPTIQDFVSQMVTLGFQAIPKVISVIQFLGNAFLFIREIILNARLAVISVVSAFLQFGAVKKIFESVFGVIQEQLLFTIALFQSFVEILALLPGAEKFLGPVAKGIEEIGNKVAGLGAGEAFHAVATGIDAVGVATATTLDGSDALFKSFNKNAESAKKFSNGLAESVKNIGANANASALNLEKLNSAAVKGGGGFASGGSSAAAPASAAATSAPGTPGASADPKKQAETISETITKSFGLAASTFGVVLGGGFLASTNDFISGLGNLPAKFLDLIGSMGSIVENLLESLPAIGEKLVSAVPGIITKIADALPALASKLGEVFEKLAGAIADSAPKLAEGLLDAIIKLVDAVPRIVDRLVSALPKLFSAILKKLPALISAILRAIPQIVKSLAAAIPELVTVLANEIGPIVLALVQGILEAIPEIILALIDVFLVKGGLFKIIVAIQKAIPSIAIALVQGIIRSAINSTQALFGFIKNIFGGALGSVFSGLKFPSINIDGIKDFLTGKKFVDGIRENFGEIKDVLTGKKFIDFIRENFGEIKDVLTGKKFVEGVLANWQEIKDVLSGKKFVDGVLANFSQIKGFLNGSTFAARIKGVFDGFSENLKKILTGGLSSVGKKSGGGALEQLFQPRKFAEGGQAFKVPGGFNNDTFPAFLTSGELVVDRSTASALRDFLDQQALGSSSGSGDIVSKFDSLVARMERTSQKEVTVRIQVGEKELASAILNLNRQGFRVA